VGSIPDFVIGIFHWHNPSGRTMFYRLRVAVAALLVVVWPLITGQTTTNNAATATLQR